MYKKYHGHNVASFNDMFIFRSNVNSSNMYTSNYSFALYICRFHIDAFQHSLAIRAARYRNALPNHTVQAPTLQLFCGRLYSFNLNAFLKDRAITRLFYLLYLMYICFVPIKK